MTVRYVSIGVVAFVLLAAGAAWSVGRSKPVSSNLNAVQNTPVAKNIENSAALSAPVAAADVSLGALTVQNQPAGLSVAIANASVATETWLVVYESRAGKPGNVLGAALFFPGSSSGTVELLRATRAGETYFVGKSTDNGDRRFSMTTDTPVTDAAGAAQLVTFIAQ